MENKSFKLIDGKFTKEEAEQIVTKLFNYKIDYHNREDFSNHIRFNNHIEHSKTRVQELVETKESIIKLLNENSDYQKKLIIRGDITIQFEK